jgi:hypothetical protein
MRAFTIVFAGAMLGAVSLATMGAVSTVSQTRHTAIAFRAAAGGALARYAYDGQPALSAVSLPITPAETAHAGKDGGRPFRTTNR